MTAVEIIPERIAELEKVPLQAGGHKGWEHGACVMEAVAYVTGEPWSDHPKCASPVLTAYAMRLNDRWPDDLRQQLKPFIPRLVGTRDGQDPARRAIAAQYTINTAMPHWLELAGMPERADELRSMEVTEWNAELRDLLYGIRNECWDKRAGWRAELKAKVRAEVEKRLKDKPAAAAADAVTAAAADAVTAAVAAADAVTAAAAADAVTVTVTATATAADAVTAAVAVAAAVTVTAAATAAAAVTAAADPWGDTYNAVYEKVKPIYEEKLAPLNAERAPAALELLERMIDPSKVAA